jgi:Ca2+-transporting ATPase
MTVTKVFVDGKMVDVEGIGYTPTGVFMHKGTPFSDDTLELLLLSGILCNNAEHTAENKIIGDPTEGALIVSAKKYGMSHDLAKRSHVRIHELPFDSARKMMSTVHKFEDGHQLIIKGAPDQVLLRCDKAIVKGKPCKLTPAMKKEILAKNEEMATSALRVLAFACKKVSGTEETIKNSTCDALESGLTFIGLQGMIDPPRKEVFDAVRLCKDAGIRIFVISGDFGVTTKAIAKELGIADEETPVVTGEMLSKMPDNELTKMLCGKVVFARVNPEHKMRIVTLLKGMGEIVAVTGDGVNDAPAIKRADIGIAMGITGTDVSKEASDMVLMDDSFATIVLAVKEGRAIYADIKKFLTYIFTSNIGELLTVFLGMIAIAFLKFPPGTVIITATQILWVNLGTDVLPALALSVDPPEENIMQKHPRDPKRRIITRQVFFSWLPSGALIALGTISVFLAYRHDPLRAGTVAFCTLVIFQMMNVFNCRSKRESLFSMGFFSNRLLLLAVLFSVALQVLVVYVPFMQGIFSTVTLSVGDWVVILLVSSTIIIYGEIAKAVMRKRRLRENQMAHPSG